jgi:hypothetical protein
MENYAASRSEDSLVWTIRLWPSVESLAREAQKSLPARRRFCNSATSMEQRGEETVHSDAECDIEK